VSTGSAAKHDARLGMGLRCPDWTYALYSSAALASRAQSMCAVDASLGTC
jgi:hypothetical protein